MTLSLGEWEKWWRDSIRWARDWGVLTDAELRRIFEGVMPTTPVDPGTTLLGPLAAGSLIQRVSSW